MANVGRNDPCPCGSGRKYKQCCLHQVDSARTLRVRLRQAEARVVAALLAFALDRWGKDLMIDAWEEFLLWTEEVPADADEIVRDPDFQPLFLPWFLFSYVPDPYDEDPLPDAPTAAVGLTYLEEHGAMDALDRQLIESACAGAFSFYAVQEVTRGESLSLQDILTGTRLQALEQSGTDNLAAGDILFAHAATAGGGTILVACAPFVIPPTWHNPIIDFRQRMWKRRRPQPQDLIERAFEIRDFFFHLENQIYDPQPPKLTNTDGETLELTTLTYALNCSTQEAFDVLRNLEPPNTGDDGDDVERGDDGTLRRATVRWLKDDGTLLAAVTIEDGALRVEVNSAERAARIQDEIASRLGDRAALTGSTALSTADLMTKALDAGAPPPPDAFEDRPPELAAIEAELMAKHWEAWVDEPVPALGGKTPRQAARSALGRERLEALFADFGWRSESQPPHMRIDVAGLRKKLKM
jgi:hypothetical protein